MTSRAIIDAALHGSGVTAVSLDALDHQRRIRARFLWHGNVVRIEGDVLDVATYIASQVDAVRAGLLPHPAAFVAHVQLRPATSTTVGDVMAERILQGDSAVVT